MEEKKRDWKKYYNLDVNREATKRYAAKNIVQVKFQVNRNTDADILEMLESVPNKQGYIKQLIRDDIARRAGTAQG